MDYPVWNGSGGGGVIKFKRSSAILVNFYLNPGFPLKFKEYFQSFCSPLRNGAPALTPSYQAGYKLLNLILL